MKKIFFFLEVQKTIKFWRFFSPLLSILQNSENKMNKNKIMVSFVPAQKGAKNMKNVLMADPEALSLVGGEAHHHQPSAVHSRTC